MSYPGCSRRFAEPQHALLDLLIFPLHDAGLTVLRPAAAERFHRLHMCLRRGRANPPITVWAQQSAWLRPEGQARTGISRIVDQHEV
jgi:hypothetical protein